MSDFLTLVGDLHTEVGAAGVAPTSVVNQTGEAKRLVRWVAIADYKIQLKWINWKFLRAVFSTGNTTSVGVATLAKPATLKTWDLKTFQIVAPGETDKNPIDVVEYEDVKDEIVDTDQGIPSRITIMPDNSLRFEPVPDGIYTIHADFYSKPIKMAANIDVSLIPEEQHDTAILGRAMMLYANHENAPEIKEQGRELYSEGLGELENHQLPNKNYSRNRTGGGFEVVGGQSFDD